MLGIVAAFVAGAVVFASRELVASAALLVVATLVAVLGTRRQLVDAETVRDPLFTEQDIDEALALVAYDAENCSGCGLPKAETFNPLNEWAYEAETFACAACAARRRAEHRLTVLDGVYSFVRKRERRRP